MKPFQLNLRCFFWSPYFGMKSVNHRRPPSLLEAKLLIVDHASYAGSGGRGASPRPTAEVERPTEVKELTCRTVSLRLVLSPCWGDGHGDS